MCLERCKIIDISSNVVISQDSASHKLSKKEKKAEEEGRKKQKKRAKEKKKKEEKEAKRLKNENKSKKGKGMTNSELYHTEKMGYNKHSIDIKNPVKEVFVR